MTCYLISTDIQQANNAGYKAKHDIITILDKIEPIYIPSKLRIMNSMYYLTAGFKRITKQINRGDTVIIQYPLEGFYPLSVIWMKKLYRYLAVQKKVKIISIIHDLDGLRYVDDKKVKNEIEILNYSNTVIAHSNAMKQWLLDHGIKDTKIEILELFDYLSDKNSDSTSDNTESGIVFAGNLNKSTFLKKETTFDLTAYGPCDFVEELPHNVHYKGSVNPDELVSIIANYQFGLVWDGESLDTITGNIGHYLKYNSPHKFSLYLAAGVPVITWKKAAIASIIEKYNIGIAVNSLTEIQEVMNHLSEDQYQLMKENVKQIQAKLLKGEFIKEALRKVEK